MVRKKDELPKTVFVRKVTDDGEEPYLTAWENAGDIAEMDNIVVVGEYKLIRKLKISTDVIVTPQ